MDVFKERSFVLLVCGKFISLAGTSIYQIGLTWYVLSRYGENSGTILAWLMILGVLPAVLFGAVIGSLVDRWNKKAVLVVSDLCGAAAVLLLMFTMRLGHSPMFLLLPVTALLSVTASFVSITTTVLLPGLFSGDRLYAANSVNHFVERITLLFGFAAGGALAASVGMEAILFVNGISFLVSAAFCLFIKYESAAGKAGEVHQSAVNFVEDAKEVARFVRRSPELLLLVFTFTAVNFFWDPLLNINMPYTMKNVFGISPFHFGIMQAALPLGFCLGAAYFTWNGKCLQGRAVIFHSILGTNTVLLLFSLPVIFFPLPVSKGWMVAYFSAILVIAGIFSSVINISMSTYLQAVVPDTLRGKFTGIVRSLSAGLLPIGAAVSGALADRVKASVLFTADLVLVYLILFIVLRVKNRIAISAEISYNNTAKERIKSC